MTVGRLVRRGLGMLVRWWWRDVRPSTGARLAGQGTARTLHEAGRAPTSQERWLPATEATGPWADVDPHAAGRWPRRTSLLVVAAWAGVVGLRVRRDLRATTGSGRAPSAPAERGA